MAPNAATYGALAPPDVGAKAQRPEVSLKLTVAVAVCSVLLFFAGRAPPSEFSHDEITDLAQFCDGGKFIGGCSKCKECAMFEFANGGCSFFKDTFCTFCQPIDDCPRELIQCTGVHNHQCTKCNCDDPIKDWDEHEVRSYLLHHPRGQGKIKDQVQGQTFGCYISDVPDPEGAGTCKPCTVCPVGKWQREPCDQDTNADTVCVSCTECQEHEYTARACTYFTDTECRTCTYCADDDGRTIGTWTAEPCVLGNILTAGQDAVCKECTTCDDGMYVNAFCEAGARLNDRAGLGSDTQCHKCSTCEGSTEETQDTTEWKEHIAGQRGICKKGERFPGDGCDDDSKEGGECVNHDTVCQDCLFPREDAGCDKDGSGCDFFFATPCVADSPDAPILKPCKTCGGATFELRGCSAFQGSVCKACAENSGVDPSSGKVTSGLIEHCAFEDHRCAADGSFVDAMFGVHHALSDKADKFEGGVANIHNFDYEDEINYDHVVLSWCAREDNTGACNGMKKLYWEDEGKKEGQFKGLVQQPDPDQDMSEECNFDACDEGFIGERCQYAKVYQSCGGKPFMKRKAKKGKYWYNDKLKGQTPAADLHYAHSEERSMNQFITWCYTLCEEHPFCDAFDVIDGGVDGSESGGADVTSADPDWFGHLLLLTEHNGFGNEIRNGFADAGEDAGALYAQTGRTSDAKVFWSDARIAAHKAMSEGNECRFYSKTMDLGFCETSDCNYHPTCSGDDCGAQTYKQDDAPDWRYDCFVNTLRAPDALQKEAACPGDAPVAMPALYPGSFEPDVNLAKDQECDGYSTGESWCPALGKCVNRAHTPCAEKKELRDQCKGENEGKVFCYCTGRCMDPDTEECEDYKYEKMPEDAGLTKQGMIEESCWAVRNNFEEVPVVKADE